MSGVPSSDSLKEFFFSCFFSERKNQSRSRSTSSSFLFRNDDGSSNRRRAFFRFVFSLSLFFDAFSFLPRALHPLLLQRHSRDLKLCGQTRNKKRKRSCWLVLTRVRAAFFFFNTIGESFFFLFLDGSSSRAE